jgi:hypothetical protein
MIVRASLKLTDSGRQYNLHSCRYGLFQETDQETGQPTSDVRSYFLSVVLANRDTEDKEELLAWGVTSDQEKEGEVVLYQSGTDAPHKKIKFEGGVLVSLSEVLTETAGGDASINVALHIATRKITIGENNPAHTNDW